MSTDVADTNVEDNNKNTESMTTDNNLQQQPILQQREHTTNDIDDRPWRRSGVGTNCPRRGRRGRGNTRISGRVGYRSTWNCDNCGLVNNIFQDKCKACFFVELSSVNAKQIHCKLYHKSQFCGGKKLEKTNTISC